MVRKLAFLILGVLFVAGLVIYNPFVRRAPDEPDAAGGTALRAFADTARAGRTSATQTGDAGEESASAGKAVPLHRSEIQLSFAPLVRETQPAVVNVHAARAVERQRSPFANDPFFGQFFGDRRPQPRMQASLGSGVIVDPAGLVVTNHHVIANADEIRIQLADGRAFDTQVLLDDESIDLGVLTIDGGEGNFPSIALADSDSLEIGDLVLAIGNPFGIGQTVTNGIVSALARGHLGLSDFGSFIQTDAAINPGNSGGALVDMNGQLAGINSAIFSRSGGSNGIGFAIPSNVVRRFVEAAKNGEVFSRPYIGASLRELTPDLAASLDLDRPLGALVQHVEDTGPAAEAGLQDGDVILQVDGRPIRDPSGLDYQLLTSEPDTPISLTVSRDGRERTMDLVPVAPPENPSRDERTLSGRNPLAGATILNLSPKVADLFDLDRSKRGVVVGVVADRSPAKRFGFQPGDILLSLNDEAIDSTRGLESRLSNGGDGWRFSVDRGGQILTQVVR